MSRRISAAVLFVAAVTAPAWIKAEPPKPSADSLATVLPQAETEQVGMSVERLQRIHTRHQPYIDDGRLAGVVTLVARRGRLVHFEARGLADIEAKTPCARTPSFAWRPARSLSPPSPSSC